MSRTRKAGIAAAFGYLQFGLAFVSGIILVPFILKHVGTQNYGLWLACGELLAYSAMVDLGVLSVLPWIIAEKDGKSDRQAIRTILANGLAVAAIISVFYLVAALLIWSFASKIVALTAIQRETLVGPLLLVIAGTTIAFPLRTFVTVLLGLQDVFFSGLMSICQWGLNIFIILVLLTKGYGLYALAVAATIPPVLFSTISLIRIKFIAPDLLTGWNRPSFSKMYYLIGQGFGAWLGGFGWRMTAASNSIIIVSVSGPEKAVVYACTAKLAEVLMQLAWLLSDSGLVGLAQLHGEGKQKRIPEVVLSMLRVLLITGGGVAFVVLAFNASFVSLWVGADKFGGFGLNLLLAASVIGLSLTHGLFVAAATLGNRFQVGLVNLIQGLFNLSAAIPLVYLLGLPGVAVASLCSSILLSLPLGIRIFQRPTQLSLEDIWRAVLVPWCSRIVPVLIISVGVGIWMSHALIHLWVVLVPILGFVYIWHMRPLYNGLPLPLSVKPWLIRLKLIPQQQKA